MESVYGQHNIMHYLLQYGDNAAVFDYTLNNLSSNRDGMRRLCANRVSTMKDIAIAIVPDAEKYDYGGHSARIGRFAAYKHTLTGQQNPHFNIYSIGSTRPSLVLYYM